MKRLAAFPRRFSRPTRKIPWKQIIGMRHKVVHDYLQVDFDIVWAVVTADLPPLIADLERFVPPLSP